VGLADAFTDLPDLCEIGGDEFHTKTKEVPVPLWTAIAAREKIVACDLHAADLELKADSQVLGSDFHAAITKLRVKPRLSVSDQRVECPEGSEKTVHLSTIQVTIYAFNVVLHSKRPLPLTRIESRF
jgi:hypothetical protein